MIVSYCSIVCWIARIDMSKSPYLFKILLHYNGNDSMYNATICNRQLLIQFD
ncbi:hypothetical protein GCM10008025_26570 [Ornithinibacillus halotolerans]|uniref:Uncharacterized protein n=1 Tax=Ornithinibacillus halotolerans TaxID=1274357 RepID=A0A916WB60_9BACI|nr:hypothetical protein GCM10008025_26570 [Ornithinibacillus halotolerans]